MKIVAQRGDDEFVVQYGEKSVKVEFRPHGVEVYEFKQSITAFITSSCYWEEFDQQNEKLRKLIENLVRSNLRRL